MNRAPLASHRFQCFTAADPARVWAALTDTRASTSYMYGLVTSSSWEVGAPVHVQGPECRGALPSALTGRVLHVEPPRRLSYVLQSRPDDPPVYLTWQIRTCPGGTTIGLQVDEFDSADGDEEAEDIWLPVLAALQARLAREIPLARDDAGSGDRRMGRTDDPPSSR